MNAQSSDPRLALLSAPMSTYQKVAVALTILLCMLDGFDVIAITFAAPTIRATWHVNQAEIGLVLAAALLGMAAGSLIIAPAADLLGRRRIILASLGIMILGDIASAFTSTVAELMTTRAFTGIGIGTMIAVISSLAAEYANARSRDLCMTLWGCGFSLGGMLGGLGAAVLLPAFGWPAIFVTGATLALCLLLAAAFFLPEPIAAQIARPTGDTLAKVNVYLARCGLSAVAELPAPPPLAASAPLRTLFGGEMVWSTVLITAIYFLHVITLFFFQSWVPSLVVAAGFAPAKAALVAVWVSVGGIAGGVVLGASSMRLGLKPLVLSGLAGGAVLTAVFGALPAKFAVLSLGSLATGFFMQGGMMGLYATVARTFPAHVRASGTGLVIGIGRIGSALGPVLGGALLSAGATRGGVAVAMAIPSLLAAILLTRFSIRTPNAA